jgi:hypothetical protein
LLGNEQHYLDLPFRGSRNYLHSTDIYQSWMRFCLRCRLRRSCRSPLRARHILHANALGEVDVLHRASGDRVVDQLGGELDEARRDCSAQQEAGPNSAAIFSIVESCRKRDVPIRKYLAEVLPGLADPESSLWPNSPQRSTAPKRQSGLSPAAQRRQHMVLDGWLQFIPQPFAI